MLKEVRLYQQEVIYEDHVENLIYTQDRCEPQKGLQKGISVSDSHLTKILLLLVTLIT
jgi:hypothetical protein